MLYDALQAIAEQHPDAVAFKQEQCVLTYAQLWQRSRRIAAQLQAAQVKQGERVCLLSENSVDAVVVFWAVLHCNAIAVYLNEQTPADGLLQIIDDAEPVLIVATARLAGSKLADCTTLETRVTDMASLCETASSAHAELPAHDSGSCNDPALIATIVYTSGSTGKPKGVCLTHTNLLSVAKMAADGYATTASDLYLMVVPLHYIHGLMILMAMNLRGACIQFMNSFLFPKLVTEKLQSSGATGFSGVPFHFTALIERGGFLSAELPHLRWIGVTGGRCSHERLMQLRQAHPDLQIHISYGLTECSPRITALHPDKIDNKSDSVGEVADGLTVEFLDEHGHPVASNDVGELVVSGPNVMHGYWNDADSTRRVIDEKGRLHTGDLAYMDDEGDIFIKGRVQAMIKSAGERIFPEELEKILSASGLVEDVAVVGMPDKLYGQRVEAHVILLADSDESLEALKAYCLEHIAFSRSPKHYHRWREFPSKANGKIDKQALIQQINQRASP
jgi:acyl-CoA synthetase (AMP-forming)/AMP-acid ligase II